ncbi:5232_t:CDS:2, partial [Cetraspora pellucida]
MIESDSSLNGSTDLQDLLMCESYIDDIMSTINNNPSTAQSSTATLPEFETQIQSMLVNNNTKDSSSFQLNDLLNSFQYPAPFSDMLSLGSPKSFLYLPDSTSLDNICPESMQYSLTSDNNSAANICSQEPFLFSPNSANFDNISTSNPLYYSPNSSEISEDISSPDTLSPLNYTLFQDLNVSPTNSALADFGSYSSPTENTFEALLPSGFNIDPIDIEYENNRKRVSVGYDSVSSDESSKKKRKGANGTVKSVKKTNTYVKSTKKFGSNKNGTNPDINATFEEDCSPSKSPVIDMETIKALFASLSDTANRTAEPSDVNLVQDDHSDEEDDECTSSDTKLSTPRSKSPTATSQNSKPSTNKQQKKLAHNVIERRYRNNINDRINDLKSVVPALCHLKNKDDDVIEEVDGIPAATKTNKATILKKATEYIVYLKKNNEKFKTENDILKRIILTIPGGLELFENYLTNIGDDMKTPPATPPSEFNVPYKYKSPTSGNAGSRLLMSFFMCMTFLTDISQYAQSAPHHHSEGRVIVSNTTESIVPDGIYNSQDGMTINIWYLAKIFTFLMCFTYVIWPSLFSIKTQPTRKSAINSVLSSKIKDATELYTSLSNLTNISSMSTLGFVIGLFIESLRLFLRRFLNWEISCGYVNVEADERLLEVELWNRLGEVELCGGNKCASNLSVLYTCLRTINLLENPYTYHRKMRISSSRIYANAALQCHVGLRSVPFLSRRAVSHFWNLAIKEKGKFNPEEKWLKIALISDQNNDIWESAANRICDHVFNLSKNEKVLKPIISTNIPLTYISEIQALLHIKGAFSNLISERQGMNKTLKECKFTFSELFDITTPASLMHWYALVGCAIQAFHESKNDSGVKLINKLREESRTNDNLSKRIITVGLLSRSLLICGKVEASIHCADKASDYLSSRKNEKTETTDIDKDWVIGEILNDVHDLAEFCVGWI